jgi:hypothetical protein
MIRGTSALVVFVLAASLNADGRQTSPGPQTPGNRSPAGTAGGILGRPSPPQPLQKQGVEYFIGTWNFTWTGRESPVTPGPRTGTTTFTRRNATSVLDLQTVGQVEGLGTYKEAGTWEWLAAQKTMVIKERLAGGAEAACAGDWASPISIRCETEPIRLPNQTVRLRRTYGIVSATSFTVAEEISIDGKGFTRLGGGVFSKAAK